LLRLPLMELSGQATQPAIEASAAAQLKGSNA